MACVDSVSTRQGAICLMIALLAVVLCYDGLLMLLLLESLESAEGIKAGNIAFCPTADT